jgi:hypothetical protein
MRRWLVALALVLLYAGYQHYDSPALAGGGLPQSSAEVVGALDNPLLQQAFEQRRSNLLVEGNGVVTRLLADDNDGSRHQRFILQVNPQQTVLVAHNIDLAPRIESLAAGDEVVFSGQYEWNSKGGVLHWTHHDPQGRHPGGWLRHEGRTYQ